MRDRTLLTIPFSHYCEKARWALDRAGLRYQERPYLPIVHYAATLRAAGTRTVPVLVTEDGALTDSTEILRWVSARDGGRLYPDALERDVAALERRFDEALGPAARQWSYGEMSRHRAFAREFFGGGLAGWQRAAVPVLRPIIATGVRVRYRATPKHVALAAARTLEVFDAVAERLADGRPYLTGDRFTAADLTFAALASPAVVPPEYGAPIPSIERWPPTMGDAIRRFRAHPAGAYALRMYSRERPRSPANS